MFISAGDNIRSIDGQLKKVKVDYLYHSIRNPRPEIESMVKQLRILQNIDPKKYTEQKRLLPFVVCGVFQPPYRRTENFAYTEFFILDIDHITAKGLSLEGLKKMLVQDSRVLMAFASPSQDGLKVMFRLKERCYDSGLYSMFYKQFALNFSQQYGLEQVIDAKTSDVARACFISIDTDAYYNENAEPVDLTKFVNTNNPAELFSNNHKAEQGIEKKAAPDKPAGPVEPGKETMDRIKSILNPAAKKREEKKAAVYVPAILDEIIGNLVTFLQQQGIVVKEVRNISYAKKISTQVGLKLAETNLFYGKHGFSVVQSPKCGTDPELNEAVAQLIQYFIDSYGEEENRAQENIFG